MPKYKVSWTRRLFECGEVIVDAANEDEACHHVDCNITEYSADSDLQYDGDWETEAELIKEGGEL